MRLVDYKGWIVNETYGYAATLADRFLRVKLVYKTIADEMVRREKLTAETDENVKGLGRGFSKYCGTKKEH